MVDSSAGGLILTIFLFTDPLYLTRTYLTRDAQAR
jgi:hypothetical protein